MESVFINKLYSIHNIMNNEPLYIKYKDSINKTISIGAKYYNCNTKGRLIMTLPDKEIYDYDCLSYKFKSYW